MSNVIAKRVVNLKQQNEHDARMNTKEGWHERLCMVVLYFVLLTPSVWDFTLKFPSYCYAIARLRGFRSCDILSLEPAIYRRWIWWHNYWAKQTSGYRTLSIVILIKYPTEPWLFVRNVSKQCMPQWSQNLTSRTRIQKFDAEYHLLLRNNKNIKYSMPQCYFEYEIRKI